MENVRGVVEILGNQERQKPKLIRLGGRVEFHSASHHTHSHAHMLLIWGKVRTKGFFSVFFQNSDQDAGEKIRPQKQDNKRRRSTPNLSTGNDKSIERDVRQTAHQSTAARTKSQQSRGQLLRYGRKNRTAGATAAGGGKVGRNSKAFKKNASAVGPLTVWARLGE